MALPDTSRPRTLSRRAVVGREREVARIRRALEHVGTPRFQMMLIVVATTVVGFFASVGLLALGVESLWLRYPLAVAIAYLAFLTLLWCWLRLRSDLFDGSEVLDVLDVAPSGEPGPNPEPCAFGGGEFGGGGAGGSFDDAPLPAHPSAGTDVAVHDQGATSTAGGIAEQASGALDLEELAVVLVAIAALFAALWAALWLVWGAPLLLAELAFDAAFAAGLYRRVRHVRGDHWLRTAFLRTAGPFAAVMLLFALAGGVMQHVVPDARSVGRVVEAIRDGR